MSKTQSKFNFYEKNRIENNNYCPLKKTKLTVPFSFYDGNNEILKFDYYSNSINNIEVKKDERLYAINFIDTSQNYGEFILQGELMNRCKGEYICDLTDEEIEKHIPEDFIYNKEKFMENAESIIKNYDILHKNDLINVPDLVKIRKWVH